MKENEFEEYFKNSLGLKFFKSKDYSMEPPLISIIFKDETESIKPYKYLYDNLTKDELALVFKIKNNNTITLSIIDKVNSKIFSIENLNYSKSELIDFKKNGKFGKYSMFAIGYNSNGQFTLSEKTKSSPLLVSELVFSEN
jgi:hypothetical protein